MKSAGAIAFSQVQTRLRLKLLCTPGPVQPITTTDESWWYQLYNVHSSGKRQQSGSYTGRWLGTAVRVYGRRHVRNTMHGRPSLEHLDL